MEALTLFQSVHMHARQSSASKLCLDAALHPPQDFTIVELPRSGAKVGIVGLTTIDTVFTSSPGE